MLSSSLSALWEPGRLPLVRVPFPGLQERLERIFPLLHATALEFLVLSPEEQLQCSFWDSLPDPKDYEPDLGLTKRSQAHGKDDKVYFHFSRELLEHELPQQVPSYSALAQQTSLLYEETLATVLPLVETLEVQLCVPGLLKAVEEYPLHKLRLLWYQSRGGVAAKRHLDRSLLTFPLGETHPGLVVGEESKVVPSEPNWAGGFPGRKTCFGPVAGLMNPPLLHGVEVEPLPEEEYRESAVFFLHAPWAWCD